MKISKKELKRRKKISDTMKRKGLKPPIPLREKNPRWKGGRRKQGNYIMILCPSHPFSDCGGYIMEHRLRMEKHLGRYLLPTEIVHHINGDSRDNRGCS